MTYDNWKSTEPDLSDGVEPDDGAEPCHGPECPNIYGVVARGEPLPMCVSLLRAWLLVGDRSESNGYASAVQRALRIVENREALRLSADEADDIEQAVQSRIESDYSAVQRAARLLHISLSPLPNDGDDDYHTSLMHEFDAMNPTRLARYTLLNHMLLLVNNKVPELHGDVREAMRLAVESARGE